MPNVILFCEPAMTRGGLSLLLKGIPEVETLQVAGSHAELDALRDLNSIWVVYLNSPSTIEQIGPYLHDPQALLLIQDDDQNSGLDPRGLAPAWGLVTTRISPEALRMAILALAHQLNVFEPGLISRVEPTFTAPIRSDEKFEALTDRELTVFRKVAEGLTNKKIAQELGISENTVKFHISALFSKLNASSRTDAVRKGVRSGLLAI